MDIPRLVAMDRFWRRHPPLRDMVQAYLGIEVGAMVDSGAGNNIDDLVQAFGGIGGSL